ncbi:MAG: hypothetical protein H8E34_14030 [Bacteroidetes bacterium]|nr:hypothetical protein [Bacteroidota bacterium]
MIRLLFISLIFILIQSNIFSQSKNVYITNITSGTSGFTLQKIGNQQKYESHFKYLNSAFEAGSMILNSSSIITSVSFRYDITNDRMEMKSYINPDAIDKIQIGRQSFIYSDYEVDGNISKGYFEVLSTGNVRLLERREVKRKSAKAGLYGYEGYQMIINTLFVKFGDKPAVSIHKRSKNEIISLFPDSNEKINNFVNDNKLRLKNEDEIIECLKYYNSLTK